jgi:isopenicillin N synthase-like dioxygenase
MKRIVILSSDFIDLSPTSAAILCNIGNFLTVTTMFHLLFYL